MVPNGYMGVVHRDGLGAQVRGHAGLVEGPENVSLIRLMYAEQPPILDFE